MIAGRIVKCIVQFFVLGFSDEGFVFTAFIAGAFTNAIPGIILQIIIIPLIMLTLQKLHLITFKKEGIKQLANRKFILQKKFPVTH